MVTMEQAKYALQEIRNISFYRNQIKQIDIKLKNISDRMMYLSSPKSPNGGTDITINGVSMRVKVSGNPMPKETVLNDLISVEMMLDKKRYEWIVRLAKAKEYREELLANTDEPEFVRDSLEGMRYRELEEKYNMRNAYDHMLRLIKNGLREV